MVAQQSNSLTQGCTTVHEVTHPQKTEPQLTRPKQQPKATGLPTQPTIEIKGLTSGWGMAWISTHGKQNSAREGDEFG